VYPHLPPRGKNVIAFWLYGWMTFGHVSYLNLPSNGWDTYGRGGRGYVAGRIRGANQIYVESEYRLPLTLNGLWGVVVFANGVSTANPDSGTFSRLDPGIGIGLRIKFNKHTDTNLSIDYGWGPRRFRGFVPRYDRSVLGSCLSSVYGKNPVQYRSRVGVPGSA